MQNHLSYLMGADRISVDELEGIGVVIVEEESDGSRKLEIPDKTISAYEKLVKEKLTPGFWNEMIGPEQIRFIFKLRDGSVKEMVLSQDTEREIDALCADLNHEPPGKTANVYKYLSENDFYRNLMLEHYSSEINRSGPT